MNLIVITALLLQDGAAAAKPNGLSSAGWLFMITSIVFVLALTGWCFKRVLADDDEITEPPASLGG